jgi:uncharacterized RDD family membrane protein YckC
MTTEDTMLLLILIILLILALAGGGVGYGRYGYGGLSPAAIILIILVIVHLTGNLKGQPRAQTPTRQRAGNPFPARRRVYRGRAQLR